MTDYDRFGNEWDDWDPIDDEDCPWNTRGEFEEWGNRVECLLDIFEGYIEARDIVSAQEMYDEIDNEREKYLDDFIECRFENRFKALDSKLTGLTSEKARSANLETMDIAI